MSLFNTKSPSSIKEILIEENKDKIYDKLLELIGIQKEETETTVNQQLLILDYLGVIKNLQQLPYKASSTNKRKFPNKNGIDIILSVLLNRGKENVRAKLSSINSDKIKTEYDLNIVRSIFEAVKLEHIVKDIDKELIRLQTKRTKKNVSVTQPITPLK